VLASLSTVSGEAAVLRHRPRRERASRTWTSLLLALQCSDARKPVLSFAC